MATTTTTTTGNKPTADRVGHKQNQKNKGEI